MQNSLPGAVLTFIPEGFSAPTPGEKEGGGIGNGDELKAQEDI